MVDAPAPTAHEKAHTDAGEKLKAQLTGLPVTISKVVVSNGFEHSPRGAQFNRDMVQVAITAPELHSSQKAETTIQAVLRELHKVPDIRKHVILVTPSEYLTDIKKNARELLDKAKAEGITGSNVDYDKWVGLDPNIAQSQLNNHAVDLIEDSNKTSLRIQIPVDPKNPDKAMAEANKIADEYRTGLAQLKQDAIEHVTRKNYIKGMDDAAKARLQGHEFEVSVQNQDNKWVSVFIDVRSPEQVKAKANPAEKTDPEALKKSNLFAMIPEELSRKKLASRLALFQGKELKEPRSFFLDVAGTLDVENALHKVVGRLKDKLKAQPMPDTATIGKIDELLGENVFKNREMWMVPSDKQEVWKQSAYAKVDAKASDTLRITMTVPMGEGEKIVQKIASFDFAAAKTAQEAKPAAPVAEVKPAAVVVEEKKPEAADAALASQIIKAASARAEGIVNPAQPLGAPGMPIANPASTQAGVIAKPTREQLAADAIGQVLANAGVPVGQAR